MSNAYILKVNSDTTLDFGYDTYLIDASLNDVVLTLPYITGDGPIFSISRIDDGTNNYTVTIIPGSGANLNDDANPKTLDAHENVQIVLESNDWHTLSGKWLQ